MVEIYALGETMRNLILAGLVFVLIAGSCFALPLDGRYSDDDYDDEGPGYGGLGFGIGIFIGFAAGRASAEKT